MKGMKYSERLKLSIITDILLMAVFAITYVLLWEEKHINIEALMVIALVVGALCIAAAFYQEYGELKKWSGLWKDPAWQSALFIIAGVMLIASIWMLPNPEYVSPGIALLIMLNNIERAVRYYNRAVRYGMDDLKDVKELMEKYPETTSLINKGKLGARI